MREGISDELFREFVYRAVKDGNAFGLHDEIERGCRRRLEQGGKEHGEQNYKRQDCAGEAKDEALDLIDWPFLEVTKRLDGAQNGDELLDEDLYDLAQAAAAGAMAYAALERYIDRRRDRH